MQVSDSMSIEEIGVFDMSTDEGKMRNQWKVREKRLVKG